jgi:hypothetical protein
MGKMEELGKRGLQSTNIRVSARPQDGAVFHQWMNDLRRTTGKRTVHHWK